MPNAAPKSLIKMRYKLVQIYEKKFNRDYFSVCRLNEPERRVHGQMHYYEKCLNKSVSEMKSWAYMPNSLLYLLTRCYFVNFGIL